MKMLKELILGFLLIVGLSLTVAAQKHDQKKPPPKDPKESPKVEPRDKPPPRPPKDSRPKKP